MNSRERFFATLNRETVDRPASWLGLPTKRAIPKLLDHFKVNSIEELKLYINDDIWPVEVPFDNPPHYDIGCALDFTSHHDLGDQADRVLSHNGYFFDKTDPSEVEKFKWPDPEKLIDPEEAKRRVRAIPKDKISMAFMWSAHFQDACAAFGMEQALMAAMLTPDLFKAVVDRIIKFHLRSGEIFYNAVKGELDAVAIGNDFGSQTSLMVSPDFLKELIFPGTKQLIEQAKSFGFTVMHHSCGSIFPVIENIFDMGADIVHPIQALATDMEPEKLKSNFGEIGSFCGGVDAQQLLVNGTPEQVTAKVKQLREIFPTGLIISPSHEAILPDIAPGNIEALFKAVNN